MCIVYIYYKLEICRDNCEYQTNYHIAIDEYTRLNYNFNTTFEQTLNMIRSRRTIPNYRQFENFNINNPIR